jgi:AcrR family transcriptional regulator
MTARTRSGASRRAQARHLGRPPGSTSAATRARILAAARVCFARTGYAATTNKDIAERANVTAAALYLYFDSKTALYLATVQDAYDELLAHYRRVVAEAHTLRDAFSALVATSAKLHELDPTISAFLSALPVEIQRHHELAEVVRGKPTEVVAIFEELVDSAAREGEIAREQAPHVLAMFVACTMGFSLYAAAVDGSQMGAIAGAFSALLDGTLFRERRPRRRRRS